jgi:hypothetical protein
VTAPEGVARILAPQQACAACGAPARMALGLAKGVTATDPAGRPRALGYMHEAVYFDWRAAPSIAGVRFYCKADGVRILVDLAAMYVSDDGEDPLDPWEDPDDPNVTFLARYVRDGGDDDR